MSTTSFTIENEGRRRVLAGFAGLSLALYLSEGSAATPAAPAASANSEFIPNAFLRIGSDGTITVIAKHLEMGQGSFTGLATIVAEELGADWTQVRVEAAPADASRYNNLAWGKFQGTGGSRAIANSWEQLRRAGATARLMLVQAAAQQWQVPAAECAAQNSAVIHGSSKRQATFAQLAAAAAKLPVPADAPLRDTKDFKLIGRHVPRTDSIEKTTGKALFTQDIQLPDMLVAMVAHPPLFGARVKTFDASKAKAVKGVVAVVGIPSGVAVLARDTWSAKLGREALVVEWDESLAFKMGTAQIEAQYRELADKEGLTVRKVGDAAAALASAPRRLEASYDFPYLAHAAMEPLNCVVQRTTEGCEAWFGCQMQTQDQEFLARAFGLAPEKVSIHTLYAGGSFGRRAAKHSDYVLEAAEVVKAAKVSVPVKLVWTREDDMRAGYYRPMFHHRLQAGFAPDGRILGWQHRLVGQSIAGDAPPPFKGAVRNGIDGTSVEGAVNPPYRLPQLHVDLHSPDNVGVPVQWWRSVGSTHTAFSTECFVDEIAVTCGQDPLAWRLSQLADHPRHAGVLGLAAEKAEWHRPLHPGKPGDRRGRGIAVHESFGSYVAEVAEVTVQQDGTFRVDRVICAVDCGIAVNPDVIRAQMEGGIGFALSAALHGAITLTDGRVNESNFHDYAPIRINEMPQVEVHIVPSTAKPTGVGEPGVPPLAPALANALAAATGRRVRKLPISAEQFKI